MVLRGSGSAFRATKSSWQNWMEPKGKRRGVVDGKRGWTGLARDSSSLMTVNGRQVHGSSGSFRV